MTFPDRAITPSSAPMNIVHSIAIYNEKVLRKKESLIEAGKYMTVNAVEPALVEIARSI